MSLLNVKWGESRYLCKWGPTSDYDYSMEKIKVGKWIDGSNVYRQVVTSSASSISYNYWFKVFEDPSIKQIISCTAISSQDAPGAPNFISKMLARINNGYVELKSGTVALKAYDKIILEYTKNEV